MRGVNEKANIALLELCTAKIQEFCKDQTSTISWRTIVISNEVRLRKVDMCYRSSKENGAKK